MCDLVAKGASMSAEQAAPQRRQPPHKVEYGDLWIPDAASCGISFARGRLDPTSTLLVHAPPRLLRVEIRDAEGMPLALGDGLSATDETPMARLRRHASALTREDVWPTEADYGTPVLLPGGEVGILQLWWHCTGPLRVEVACRVL